jgi:hypothetical protein
MYCRCPCCYTYHLSFLPLLAGVVSYCSVGYLVLVCGTLADDRDGAWGVFFGFFTFAATPDFDFDALDGPDDVVGVAATGLLAALAGRLVAADGPAVGADGGDGSAGRDGDNTIGGAGGATG